VKSTPVQIARQVIFQVILWGGAAWLLYPLITLDAVTFYNAKAYLYRTAAGIVIMIILLGKTIFDLFFPQEISRKKSLLYSAMLTLYSLAIAGGILFMVVRMAILFFKENRSGGTIF